MLRRVLTGTLILALSLGLSKGWAAQPEDCKPTSPRVMTLDGIEAVLKDTVSDLAGAEGQWRFRLGKIPMLILTSSRHDRMRIVAPILKEESLTSAQRKKMLEANFHTALDVRYATSHGVVYAAYIHPLSPLQDKELRSALNQVANLVKTFGTTYSGGELFFSEPDAAAPTLPSQKQDTAL